MMLKLFFLLLLFPLYLSAQISGTVVDADTQRPLENVVVVTDKNVVLSKHSGEFSTSEPSFTITLKLIGYKTKTVNTEAQTGYITVHLVPEPKELPEISISTSPFETRLKQTTGSNYIVSVSPLEKQGNISPTDLLNSIPGVFVHQGSLNTNRLTIRGIGSRTPYSTNRIKAYFGEIPLTTGDGISIVEDLDLNGVGRIEVLKGPSSAIYGSGLGGVIKMHPAYPSQNTLQFQSSLGSFNTYRNNLGLGFIKGAINGGINYTNVTSDGYRQNNNYKRHSLFLNSNYHSSMNHVSFNLIFTDLNAGIPSSLNLSDYQNNPESAARNWLNVKGFEDYSKFIAGISFSTYFRTAWQNKLSLHGGWFNQYESRPFDILDDQSAFWGFRESIVFSGSNLKATLGAEYFGEKYSYKLFNTDGGTPVGQKNANSEMRQYGNLFSYASLNITKKLYLDAGLNLNVLHYRLTDNFAEDGIDVGKDFRYQPVLSPRAGLNYTASEQFTLIASAGHGFSHPSPEETLQPEGTLNTNLKPEQGYNIELGTRLTLFKGKTYAELTIYKIYLNNLLVTKRETEAIFYGVNAGKSEHQGLEIYLNQKILSSGNNFSLLYKGAYTLSDNYFTDFTDDETSYKGKKLPGIPRYQLSNNLNFTSGTRFEATVEWQFFGQQYLNDDNTETIDGYNILNTKFSYVLFAKKKHNLTIFASALNILNSKYASMVLVNAPTFGSNKPRYYYPGEPRNFNMGVHFNIN